MSPSKPIGESTSTGSGTCVEEAARAGVKRFVQCSTMGVHGTIDRPPGNEDSPIRPDDYYQLTKYKGEVVARQLGREHGLPVSVVRPAGIYGPRETRFLKLARLIKSGRFMMFGSGEVTYHFVHVDDLCDGLVLCHERDQAKDEVFIIGDDHAIAINTVVEVMAAALGVSPPRLGCPTRCSTMHPRPASSRVSRSRSHRRCTAGARLGSTRRARSTSARRGASWAISRRCRPRTASSRWCAPTSMPAGCPEGRCSLKEREIATWLFAAAPAQPLLHGALRRWQRAPRYRVAGI